MAAAVHAPRRQRTSHARRGSGRPIQRRRDLVRVSVARASITTGAEPELPAWSDALRANNPDTARRRAVLGSTSWASTSPVRRARRASSCRRSSMRTAGRETGTARPDERRRPATSWRNPSSNAVVLSDRRRRARLTCVFGDLAACLQSLTADSIITTRAEYGGSATRSSSVSYRSSRRGRCASRRSRSTFPDQAVPLGLPPLHARTPSSSAPSRNAELQAALQEPRRLCRRACAAAVASS